MNRSRLLNRYREEETEATKSAHKRQRSSSVIWQKGESQNGNKR